MKVVVYISDGVFGGYDTDTEDVELACFYWDRFHADPVGYWAKFPLKAVIPEETREVIETLLAQVRK